MRSPDVSAQVPSLELSDLDVAICPDMNSSAIHADLWLNPRPGTDAALALGAPQMIIVEGLYENFYARPNASVPQACCHSWGQLKGAYRLLSNDDVSMRDILAAHYSSTAERIRATGVDAADHHRGAQLLAAGAGG